MDNKNDNTFSFERIDLYSVLRDVLRNLWAILLFAVAAGMVMNVITHYRMENTYTSKTIYLVNPRSFGSSTGNVVVDSKTIENYTNVLESDLLKNRVCKELGVKSFESKIATSLVDDTNLISLSVTSDSPWNTYRTIRAIMKNMNELADNVSPDMVLDVLQEPDIPKMADVVSSPRRQMILVSAVAFIVGCAIFAFLSVIKNTIRSEDELEEKLDAKSIGVMYYYKSRKSKKKTKGKLLISEPSMGFEFVESFKKIATHISSQARKNRAKIIMVTSVMEHEGKSTVSSNIALSLARQSNRVLLIDGDLRRPTLNTLFLDKNEGISTGLVDVVLDGKSLMDAVMYDEKRKLFLLLNEHNYRNSTDIASSSNMENMLSEAREQFEYIVIDTPPMSLMADAESLANYSDISLLVVGYDTVLAQDLNDAIDTLRACRAEFIGCVLNQVKTLPGERRTVVGYGGYGRYGRYSRYGKYGKYGKYGNYGNYGAYGHYGHYSSPNESEEKTE